MTNAKKQAESVFQFLINHGDILPDFDPKFDEESEKFTSPDASILFAAATILSRDGILPYNFTLDSSWGSGRYIPFNDDYAIALHNRLIIELKGFIGKRCPVCEKGTLTDKEDPERQEYKGHVAYLPLYYSSCSYCESDIGNVESSKKNKESMQNFKEKMDQLSPEQT
jgi:hypothetical protein